MNTTTDRVYLARTNTHPGYWGKHKDGVHHAIAECCDEGANRFGTFSVWEGPASLSCDPINGALTWDRDDPEPKLEGVYTAQGCYLGESLEAVAKDVQSGSMELEEFGLDRETIKHFKNHKPE